MTKRERTEVLKSWALEAGFDRAGVARLGPTASGESYRAWLERGDHAEMGYMEQRPELRLDPRRLFAGAASALCVALQYHSAETPDAQGDLWPGVARYARGRDYHNVMIKRLRKLARRIEAEFPGTHTKPYVDTGPVLERDLAAAAGLGAPGKNTMLLHPEAGSYFFLGELITSLELEAESPIADLCGSCSLCLEACPTDALPEPFRLDARRCISYWTIEHRGAIPEGMREQVGNWVFGCDICQEVCPHNDGPLVGADEAFEAAPPRLDLGLTDLLELDEARYQAAFQGSPMKRSRLEGLRRNASVAMGNSGDPGYVAALARALSDPDPVIRSHAAWALGRIGGDEALAELTRVRSDETDGEVLRALETALGEVAQTRRGANS